MHAGSWEAYRADKEVGLEDADNDDESSQLQEVGPQSKDHVRELVVHVVGVLRRPHQDLKTSTMHT